MANIVPTGSGRPQGVSVAICCVGALLAALALVAQDQQVPGDFKAKLKAKAKAAAPVQDEGPVDPAKMAHLEGKVVDGAGRPVRTAEVRLARIAGNGQVPGLPGNVTTSDNDGKFVFDIEPSPNLSLTAQKAGFSQAKYGAKAPNAPVVMFGIRAGESMNDLVLTMIQQAVLTGRVVDDAGDPVDKAQVILMRRAYQQGIRQLIASGAEQTNDLGIYRIAGLNAGRYYLVALDNKARTDGLVSVPTYFPSAAEERGATPVEVTDGQDMNNLEIRLRSGKGYAVRGTVEGFVAPSSTTPERPIAIVTNNAARISYSPIVQAIPEAVANGTASQIAFQTPGSSVNRDGTFELRQLLPGAYVLRAQLPADNGQSTTATARVIVAGSDVSGVILKPLAAITITGKVSVEGATLAEMFGTVVNTQANNGTNATLAGATTMRLVLFPAGGNGLGNQMAATAGPDGTFTLEGVQPGRYTLNQGTVVGTSIKAVRWNDTDVTEKGLVIDGSGTLEVVYRRGAVRTTGTIKNAKGEPHGGAQVVLWPVEPLPVFIANGIRNSTSDRNGAWNIGAVRPGFYYAAAFEDLDTNTAQIRDFLQMFNGVVQKVELKEGSPMTLTLDLIPAETVRKAVEKMP